MRVKEVADLVGISVRTLHHYDDIGLLVPQKSPGSGYRFYTDEDLETLQQILLFRELGFSLKRIKEIIQSPSFDREEALELHHKLLLEKRRRLEQMIDMTAKMIRHVKGEIPMTNEEKFAGFDFSQNPYEQEARERWGDAAVDRANEKVGSLSEEEKKAFSESWDAIYKKLASLRHGSPESDDAQAAIHEWYVFLNQMGDYSLEAFKGLGQMYVDDERFTKNIDRYGEGLAAFMRDAMAIYAGKGKGAK